ncbi:VanZ family protein [Modestobacter muralis]|uniref:VanZ family protein n=1 Tax=Modestobacter muralis TaxID=1608614 RepID=A0A6P0EW99_9ACTN|nr:VanZ family protein [Modestobacter muralis]NEK95345.1 VanZ family protein [Modestobacter muralis]NEN52233.1 VanZ family protein [Modestobacter muralis]
MIPATTLDRPAAAEATSGTAPAGHSNRLRPVQWAAFWASLCAAAVATLTPEGTGWAWGSPLTELRWYATGLGSSATVTQLVGNLALLAVPAVLLVALRPAVGLPRRLFAAMLGVGVGIEFLQWALPLGRVVSPMDALLNAAGAVAAGLLSAHVQAVRHQPPSPR